MTNIIFYRALLRSPTLPHGKGKREKANGVGALPANSCKTYMTSFNV